MSVQGDNGGDPGCTGACRNTSEVPLSQTDELVRAFLAGLREQALLISEVPRAFEYERDLKDAPYINLAIAAKANYLVSRDKDLLDLAVYNNSDGQQLRLRAPTLQILDPPSFLAELRRTLQASREALM